MVWLVWLWSLAQFISWLCKCWCWHKEGGGGGKRKNQELCGTAAGLALLAARRDSQADLLAYCCQKHQSHTLLPLLLCTCLQLWSQVLLVCASLKSKWPCSEPAQLIKPWDNCWCDLTALELEQLTEGTEECRARAREVEGVRGQQAGRQTEEKNRRTSPFQQQWPVSLAQLDLLTPLLHCFGQQCRLMSAKSIVKQHPMSHFSHAGKQDFTYLQLRICWYTFCIKALSQEPHTLSQEAQQMAFREVCWSAFQNSGPLCQ